MIVSPCIEIYYPFDFNFLYKLAIDNKKISTSWKHPSKKYEVPEWRISECSHDYVKKIMNDLHIEASPRFIYQSPNFFLKPHRDVGTLCSINILLNDYSTPVNFGNKEYFYKSAILDVQQEHSVKTINQERILLKFSIFNISFKDLIHQKHISKYIKT